MLNINDSPDTFQEKYTYNYTVIRKLLVCIRYYSCWEIIFYKEPPIHFK